MTPHEELLIRAVDEAKASEARAYQQMEHRTNQMLDARRAAKHMRGCMARMIGVVAARHDPQLFAQVMGCLSQEDLSQMEFDPRQTDGGPVMAQRHICTWHRNDNDWNDWYNSDCGKEWNCGDDDGKLWIEIIHCPFCGLKVHPRRPSDDPPPCQCNDPDMLYIGSTDGWECQTCGRTVDTVWVDERGGQ